MPIGEWVLAETCRALAQLAMAGCPLWLAVNVSPVSFASLISSAGSRQFWLQPAFTPGDADAGSDRGPGD